MSQSRENALAIRLMMVAATKLQVDFNRFRTQIVTVKGRHTGHSPHDGCCNKITGRLQ